MESPCDPGQLFHPSPDASAQGRVNEVKPEASSRSDSVAIKTKGQGRTVANTLRRVVAMTTSHTKGNQQEKCDERLGESSAQGQGQLCL